MAGMSLAFEVLKHGQWWRGKPYRRTLTLSEEGVATSSDADRTNFWPWHAVVGFSVGQHQDAGVSMEEEEEAATTSSAHVSIVLRQAAPFRGFEELKLSVATEHLATMERFFDEHLRPSPSSCESLRSLVANEPSSACAPSAARDASAARQRIVLIEPSERLSLLSRGWTVWRVRHRSAHAAACRLGNLALARAWNTWIEIVFDYLAYVDVASVQFQQVVVQDGKAGLWRAGRMRNKRDWALLHACQQGHYWTVRALVRRGARIGVVDGLGRNALHTAAWEGFPKT